MGTRQDENNSAKGGSDDSQLDPTEQLEENQTQTTLLKQKRLRTFVAKVFTPEFIVGTLLIVSPILIVYYVWQHFAAAADLKAIVAGKSSPTVTRLDVFTPTTRSHLP